MSLCCFPNKFSVHSGWSDFQILGDRVIGGGQTTERIRKWGVGHMRFPDPGYMHIFDSKI
jgi:hypothetical protein